MAGEAFWAPLDGASDGDVASGELLMQDGVSNPPVALETEDQDDWLYED